MESKQWWEVNKKQSHDFISILKTKIAKDPITFLLNIAAELKADNKTVKTAMYDKTSLHRRSGN